jgi:hypothetical protein
MRSAVIRDWVSARQTGREKVRREFDQICDWITGRNHSNSYKTHLGPVMVVDYFGLICQKTDAPPISA